MHHMQSSLTLVLTGGQLHPGADLVHAARVAEEEEAKADDAPHHQQHGDPHEEHGRLEGAGGNGAEVQRAPFAGELRGERVPNAVVEEAEVAGLWGADAVSDPVRLDEDHHGNDGESDGEDRPQDAHGARVTHVVGVVNFGSLLRRNHGSPPLINIIHNNAYRSDGCFLLGSPDGHLSPGPNNQLLSEPWALSSVCLMWPEYFLSLAAAAVR